MAHAIAGFAGAPRVLLQFRQRRRNCRIVDLSRRAELAFLPIPDDDIEGAEGADQSLPDEFSFESEFKQAQLGSLAAYSHGLALAWVRTNYAGGAGYQAAILWVDGARFRAGCALEQGRRRPATEWPINRALRGIGGGRDANNDEFLMFGLGRYRSCADIVAGVPDYPV